MRILLPEGNYHFNFCPQQFQISICYLVQRAEEEDHHICFEVVSNLKKYIKITRYYYDKHVGLHFVQYQFERLDPRLSAVTRCFFVCFDFFPRPYNYIYDYLFIWPCLAAISNHHWTNDGFVFIINSLLQYNYYHFFEIFVFYISYN